MGEQEWFGRLDSTAAAPRELFEHFERREAEGYTYHALSDNRHGVERGTVVVEDTDAVVRGYPSVPRVLLLETGVPAFFDDGETLAVEEKLDGFNVRIAELDDPVAFTRGGYICPYTTARARDMLDLEAFFADYPESMLCAEFVGPETPYTTHDYAGVDSHAFRVFGVRDRESGRPLPVEARRERCAAYDFPQPRLFGQYDRSEAVAGVRDAIRELDAAGREGVVMKPADGEPMCKYTTETQHHAELAYGFSQPFDCGQDFLFSRTVREAFQAVEFDESDERLRERAHDLGESILLPLVATIRAVDADETVGDRRTVRGESAAIEALFGHFRDQSLKLDVVRDDREDGERVVEFVKRAESTGDRVDYFLSGGTYDE